MKSGQSSSWSVAGLFEKKFSPITICILVLLNKENAAGRSLGCGFMPIGTQP